MKNLEQIRAKNALIAAEEKEKGKFKFVRADVAGFPALIMQNGLLSAFAYAAEAGKTTRAGMKFACDRTADHLSGHGIPVLNGKTDAKAMIKALSENPATSSDLQRATAEALLFFSYLKRFAAKDESRNNANAE
jgi:CRISPR/Cas system CMR-associated protein Cmr5 small subunit